MAEKIKTILMDAEDDDEGGGGGGGSASNRKTAKALKTVE